MAALLYFPGRRLYIVGPSSGAPLPSRKLHTLTRFYNSVFLLLVFIFSSSVYIPPALPGLPICSSISVVVTHLLDLNSSGWKFLWMHRYTSLGVLCRLEVFVEKSFFTFSGILFCPKVLVGQASLLRKFHLEILVVGFPSDLP